MDFEELSDQLPGIHCIFGVDYGSRMAGTTAVAIAKKGVIGVCQSQHRQDADGWLLELAATHQPDYLFLDAPLSLPGVYKDLAGYSNFFFREADLQLRAMSPMFLGGLTARAMRLKEQLRVHPGPVIEVYPAAVARHLELKTKGYKGPKAAIPDVLANLEKLLPFPVEHSSGIGNWHQIDALLALLSGLRFCLGRHTSFGNPDEGEIVV